MHINANKNMNKNMNTKMKTKMNETHKYETEYMKLNKQNESVYLDQQLI